MNNTKVVALGGGHGLAVTLAALRQVTSQITAIVTVADDGGSSGRLRQEFGVLPPGDLRMALTALAGDNEWGQTWRATLQHRFSSDGDMDGHAVGNLLIVALWQMLDGTTEALELIGQLLGARGRVLPMSNVPLSVEADITRVLDGREWHTTVHGQRMVAVADGRVDAIRLHPSAPQACPEAVAALEQADWIVFGPGSWYTSVIPHLLVPELAAAIAHSPARRLVTLNLVPQRGETQGYTAADHLAALHSYAPGIGFDVVIVDPEAVSDLGALEALAAERGGKVLVRAVRAADGSPAHDPLALAGAYRDSFCDRLDGRGGERDGPQ
ncbi:MAG: uridine diphosphate-N-acetylglucosamine-binding protein YvcK [Bifidobacteriaceae bacterium]|jgi:uncharacterized cofD-like protein|nr:uridine diphosphate-N-acetylglucosamine-binding protein YvcK [Bifidobacteriaceae bacterium]